MWTERLEDSTKKRLQPRMVKAPKYIPL
jgi:hypothetical protein